MQPVSVTSLALTFATGCGLLYWFQQVQDQKLKGQFWLVLPLFPL